jgi:N-acetylneuraminate synthase
MNDSVFIIAEAGVNHNGSLDLALQLVDAAADAGADAVKFQTFKSANLVTAAALKADYQTQQTDTAESQLDMLRKLELSPTDHLALIERCHTRGIEFISTPFDSESLDLLLEIGVGRIKIPSGELTNAPLLHQAARSGLPVILSTGMATLEEVHAAVSVLAHGYAATAGHPSIEAFENALPRHAAALTGKLTLLHCTTEYPSPFADTNLRAMDTLAEAFHLPVGLSDHTPGISVAIAAAARGASMLEKHMTLDRNLPGPDHQASLDPADFARLTRSIREVSLALGSSLKQPAPSELKNLAIVRKSLVAAQPIRAGEPFTPKNLTAKRPGGGLSPLRFWDLLGKPADRDYALDQPIDAP